MKQCKDCKWWRRYIWAWFYTYPPKWFFAECALWLHDRKPICLTPQKELYERKWWKLWAPKLILILALLLCGCSQTIATYKDGVATVKRTRILMTEDIGSFSYDATDGSFTLDGYKSDMTKALMLIDKLAAKDEDETKEVK